MATIHDLKPLIHNEVFTVVEKPSDKKFVGCY